MRRIIRGIICLLVGMPLFAADPVALDRDDWPWWRGFTRDGTAAPGQEVPTTWSETEHIIWKVDVPGRGHASPTLVGDRVFLATGDREAGTQSVVAFNRANGKQLWQQTVNTGGLPAKIHNKNTHASGTVACDGRRVFCAFYNNQGIQVAALSTAGKPIWSKRAGDFNPQKYAFGYGASPIIYRDWVLVASDYEKGGFLAALDRNSGATAWKIQRDAMTNYATPMVAHIDGRDQVLLGGNESVYAYDPTNGEQLWRAPGPSLATCGTLVTDGDLVFTSGGYPQKFTVCVKDGREVWRNNQKAYEQSMLVHEGHLYMLNDNGIAYCWKTSDGKEQWRERLGGPVSASPVRVGDLIYQANEKGSTFVFKADPSGFQLVAENKLGDDSFATQSICGNRIYTRVGYRAGGTRREMLVCIGK
ncbi:MAG: PQQ-binding-like beta-propeller repeat protein [Verrucomicrobiota bacterium]